MPDVDFLLMPCHKCEKKVTYLILSKVNDDKVKLLCSECYEKEEKERK